MHFKIKVCFIIHYCSGFKKPEIVCASALGIEDANQIPDSAIVASSQYNTYYGPERARLRLVTQGSFIGGWSPKSSIQGSGLNLTWRKIPKSPELQLRAETMPTGGSPATRYPLESKAGAMSHTTMAM